MRNTSSLFPADLQLAAVHKKPEDKKRRRRYETQKSNPRLIDKNAVEIIKNFDYDFSDIEKTQAMSQHGWVARSLHTDRMALEFLKKLLLLHFWILNGLRK